MALKVAETGTHRTDMREDMQKYYTYNTRITRRMWRSGDQVGAQSMNGCITSIINVWFSHHYDNGRRSNKGSTHSVV